MAFQEEVDTKTDEGQAGPSAPSLVWDIAVNSQHIGYSNGNRTAKLIGTGCTIRSPFWKSGRHVVNLRVSGGHLGVGLVNKAFLMKPGNWIGQDVHGYGTWDNVIAYHGGKGLAVTHQIKLVKGDIVTVDVDVDHGVLNWAINGQYLSAEDIATDIPNEVALAASLWTQGSSVEIVQYKG